MIQLVKALQARALARRHIALLPADDWNLGVCHRNERRGGRRPLDADAGGPELNHVVPDIALLALAIPLQFLKARRKVKNAGKPRLYPFLVRLVKLPVLLVKPDLR